ncbi:hypothetical protein IWQ47_003037 [Aquimarina sp. EL_43]|uniref:hypothetical protein n=1 Tax=unclassified Aquimarina TaxID=2627091 RepID=UPI0018C95EC9|nr:MULTISPECIES: hypothetical protein [unclassified Aquimarina]MBG6131643.1 hypothetical protein [Aquimarina sp. EL_35]MBG6152104.1 hypothetical protein [Aquimarina sp. EL_32]MBG6169952.1 hypothetical protein [Aquimarina sp. EL_43]
METKKEEFEFVYVENNGTVRELDTEEVEYLQTEFQPGDGARPYIKSNYNQRTPDNKISGFILRNEVPENIEIIRTDLRYLEIRFPINIYDSGKAIELPLGIYSVKVIGGWDVSIGNFTFTLKNMENGKIINPEVTNWRFQSYESGQRAKKIMVLDIPERGNYIIEFKNQKSLKVRPSNLIITRLFEKQIPNRELRIWIG